MVVEELRWALCYRICGKGEGQLSLIVGFTEENEWANGYEREYAGNSMQLAG